MVGGIAVHRFAHVRIEVDGADEIDIGIPTGETSKGVHDGFVGDGFSGNLTTHSRQRAAVLSTGTARAEAGFDVGVPSTVPRMPPGCRLNRAAAGGFNGFHAGPHDGEDMVSGRSPIL